MLDTPCKPGTPRSMRDLTQHHSEIIVQMRDEMVYCLEWDATGFGHYLPFEVSMADIEAATSALKVANLPIGTVNEKKRYEPLVDIANVLQKLTLLGRCEASCQFMQQPDNFNEGKTYGANFKIDALLKLKRSAMPPSSLWSSAIPVADLAVPSRYKTVQKDAREHRKQLLGATTFCVNDDPYCTHIYGITIEDNMMAIWYFSRLH
ncbi:hypothetical protein JVT61DRAFT_13702 [Boletus reticuloceps]|uniref:Fungal-type protein kinase domain-containing protein n=1 Tax=Boletus reticuloceps TaxID=495285 RepID=A0A8I3AAH7_9AGAM|nr:hypothetical protein JVT61DRAFT_13702 [Boletus reticuloceps]